MKGDPDTSWYYCGLCSVLVPPTVEAIHRHKHQMAHRIWIRQRWRERQRHRAQREENRDPG